MEWRVSTETDALAGEDWEQREDEFMDRLLELPDPYGVIGFSKNGSLGAMFCIKAPDVATAVSVGAQAAQKALESIGYPGRLVRLEGEPFEDEEDVV